MYLGEVPKMFYDWGTKKQAPLLVETQSIDQKTSGFSTEWKLDSNLNHVVENIRFQYW